MEKKLKNGFEKAKKKAEDILNDRYATEALLDEAYKKANEQSSTFKKVKNDFATLLRMLRAWVGGEYKKIPWRVLVMGIAGLVYFVNPMDVIPDFIAGFGFIDDLTVMGFVLASMKGDLEDFRKWQDAKKDSSDMA